MKIGNIQQIGPSIIFKSNMKKSSKKGRDDRNSIEKSKPFYNDQSTEIYHPNSTLLNFTERVNSAFFKSSTSKFYACCSSIQNKELKFSPEVHPIPFQVYPKNGTIISRSKKQQWQTLIQDNRLKNLERTEAKLRLQQNELKTCTFYPNITQFEVFPTQKQQNTYQKLYREAERRKNDKVEAQRQLFDKERIQIQNYGYKKPDADKWKILNKQRFDLDPLYKRLEKVIEQKKKNKKIIADKQRTIYPFQPQVNSNSSKILQRKEIIENVVDRLIQDHKKKQSRINILRQNMQLNIKRQCPFTPSISNHLPLETQQRKKPQHKENNQNSFIPSIDSISKLMMHDRINQTSAQKIYRLFNLSVLRKAERINQIETEAYAECCFNPEINQISKQMKAGCPKHHLCTVKQPQSPSHRPEINEVSRLMSESKRAKSLDIIKKKTKEKQINYRKEEEYLKMKQCSFKPKIKDNKSERTIINNQTSIQQIAGFKRFYENVEKTQQKQKEKKVLEQKLFHLQKSYDLRMQRQSKKTSLIVPFNEGTS